MAEIRYLVTSFICVPHMVGSVFEPIRFLLPVCWLCWFVYTWTYMHIFRRIFLSNYWWQKYDIWSQASYMYPISWEALLDPSDSYFLFADLLIFTFNAHFSSHFSKQLLMTAIWYLVTSFIYVCHIVGSVFGPSDSYFLFADFVFIHIEHTFCICPFLVAFFSATIDGRNLIFGHKLHIGTPYRGKRFLTHQIPTSCLPKKGGIISEH
jgi:hypothetical protein